jgi:hypothetical protein
MIGFLFDQFEVFHKRATVSWMVLVEFSSIWARSTNDPFTEFNSVWAHNKMYIIRAPFNRISAKGFEYCYRSP